MSKSEKDKRFDEFNDKYGIYIMLAILVLLLTGVSKQKNGDKPKYDYSKFGGSYSQAFDDGYEVGREAGANGEEFACQSYNGDYYDGCIAGLEAASYDD